MSPSRSALSVLVCVVVLGVAACSSSDPSAGGQAPATGGVTSVPTTRRGTTVSTVPRPATRTKAEVIAQGDAICVASQDAIAAIPAPPSVSGLRPAVQALVNERRNEIRLLDDLGPPTTDAEAFADVVARFTAAVDALESKLPVVEQDPNSVGSDPTITKDNEDAAAAAAAFGFKVCGKDMILTIRNDQTPSNRGTSQAKAPNTSKPS